ncbi:hypothetical protein EV216_10826 [Rhodovulum steppense]|uniref:Uncharacterized protein n=1 Tax=Rhodovulum steppense TaxID=540251 RepID=A0A4R1YVL8_9RHOB|nr:hypothetical protein EV216_10826 [Rhodovulum steppense]
MPNAKRRAVRNYAKALNASGVPFEFAAACVAKWLQTRGLPITGENLDIAFCAFYD